MRGPLQQQAEEVKSDSFHQELSIVPMQVFGNNDESSSISSLFFAASACFCQQHVCSFVSLDKSLWGDPESRTRITITNHVPSGPFMSVSCLLLFVPSRPTKTLQLIPVQPNSQITTIVFQLSKLNFHAKKSVVARCPYVLQPLRLSRICPLRGATRR